MISETAAILFIYGSCAVGVLWGLFNASSVMSIEVKQGAGGDESLKDKNIAGLVDIGSKISNGANAFLKQEYAVMTIFFLVFSIVVFILVDILSQTGSGSKVFRVYATLAYIIGAITSIVCGLIGMKIAVNANFRTTFKAITSLADAWNTAFQAGCVMGFCMVSISLAMLLTLFIIFKAIYKPNNIITNDGNIHTYQLLFDLLAGYGLGGSSMALFGRVGGGIYTKAADVGADLVGKVEENLAEDSPKNPATIADNVGDNVGDIAGMGADLFGSFAESTCAALVLISGSYDLMNGGAFGSPDAGKMTAMYFPMIISAVGILCCVISSMVGIYGYRVTEIRKIETALNLQLYISTVLILGSLYAASVLCLPNNWKMSNTGNTRATVPWWYCYLSTIMGLVSGLLIGVSTDYYTSNAHYPVQEMAGICPSGAAINVIYGLALGYLSNIIPIILLSVTIMVSIYLLGMLGVALAAIGMLSNLCICLAIDAYGPISDNAGGIAEMCEIGEEVRAKTDALDAAGNTTAAVGKGFAIGSAALVSLALYGAFLTRSQVQSGGHFFSDIKINDGWVFGSMFIGAMLPYFFSALTMKSVGRAANEMVREVRRQFQDPRIRNGEIDPDYERCISVSTQASIREMIAPGCLVIFTPIVMGVVFHPKIVAGILPGAILSGIQLAISMSNTGGAWDNCKKYIESGRLVNENGERLGKGSEAHKAAVTGDTIGDPLKDTSGPSLNILVKLMAIISLVFAEGFKQTAWLGGYLGMNDPNDHS